MTYQERRAQRLAHGVHPHRGLPLAHNGRQCRHCAHHLVFRMSRNYHKCALYKYTHGPGSDILVSWPACARFEEAKP